MNKAARDYQRWRWKLRCAVTRGFSFSRFLISKKTLTCRQSVLPCACYKNDISLSGFKHGSHAGLFPGYAAARKVNTEQRTSLSAEPLRLDSLFLRAAITSQGVCVCVCERACARSAWQRQLGCCFYSEALHGWIFLFWLTVRALRFTPVEGAAAITITARTYNRISRHGLLERKTFSLTFVWL